MKLLKNFFNNNVYFWLLGISFAFISYISIYKSLVWNRTYSLIPVFLIQLCIYFLIGQILSIFIVKLFFKIDLEYTGTIVSIFALGFLLGVALFITF